MEPVQTRSSAERVLAGPSPIDERVETLASGSVLADRFLDTAGLCVVTEGDVTHVASSLFATRLVSSALLSAA